jgi:hypothetical protein
MSLIIPAVLTIKGVKPQDCELIFDLTSFEVEDNNYEIPSNYVSYKSWIKKTNVYCIHCTLPIEGIPVPIPTRCEHNAQSIIYFLDFLTCSFECAIAQIMETEISAYAQQWKIRMLKTISEDFNVNWDFKPSPNKTKLKKYGGILDDKLYKSYTTQIFESDN